MTGPVALSRRYWSVPEMVAPEAILVVTLVGLVAPKSTLLYQRESPGVLPPTSCPQPASVQGSTEVPVCPLY